MVSGFGCRIQDYAGAWGLCVNQGIRVMARNPPMILAYVTVGRACVAFSVCCFCPLSGRGIFSGRRFIYTDIFPSRSLGLRGDSVW